MPAKRRSGPKSKESDKNHPQVEGQKELRIVLEKVDESKEMQRITRASKRKAEAEAASSESVEQLESSEAATEPVDVDVTPVLPTQTLNETSVEKQIEKNTDCEIQQVCFVWQKCTLFVIALQELSRHTRSVQCPDVIEKSEPIASQSSQTSHT